MFGWSLYVVCALQRTLLIMFSRSFSLSLPFAHKMCACTNEYTRVLAAVTPLSIWAPNLAFAFVLCNNEARLILTGLFRPDEHPERGAEGTRGARRGVPAHGSRGRLGGDADCELDARAVSRADDVRSAVV